jgi:hypothetical protein
MEMHIKDLKIRKIKDMERENILFWMVVFILVIGIKIKCMG